MKRATDYLVEHYPVILMLFAAASFILASLIDNDRV